MIIHTEVDYEKALKDIEILWDSQDPIDQKIAEALVDAVIAYELIHYPIDLSEVEVPE
jgi:antitoxin component HigA of HigAB toxin-antitoxin module